MIRSNGLDLFPMGRVARRREVRPRPRWIPEIDRLEVRITPSTGGTPVGVPPIADVGTADFGVPQFPTNIYIGSQTNPVLIGQPAKIFATVTGQNGYGVPPYGKVSFYDGTFLIGVSTLDYIDPNGIYHVYRSDNTTVYTTSQLTLGHHSITAVFDGDGGFLPSTTTVALDQVVVDGPRSTTTIVASPNSSATRQAVTFTITVLPDDPTTTEAPHGTVLIYDGADRIGDVSLDALNNVVPGQPLPTRSVEFTTSNLLAGNHRLTAVYSGDSDLVGSTSAAILQPVTKGVTTTSLVSTVVSPGAGQPVVLTAMILPIGPGGGTPEGFVSFFDGATILGTVPIRYVNSPLDYHVTLYFAALTTSSLPVGDRAITAVYSGDAEFFGSTSNTVALSLVKETPKVLLDSATAPTTAGQPVTFVARVDPPVATNGMSTGVPTGIIEFYDGGTLLGTSRLGPHPVLPGGGPLVDPHATEATFTTSTLTAGPHTIIAIYRGDANFAGPHSASIVRTVVLADSSLTLRSSAPTAFSGQTVTYTATVGSPSGVNPTGQVVFYDGPRLLGSADVIGGRAEMDETLTSPGQSHPILAVYLGDARLRPSYSAPFAETLTRANSRVLVSYEVTNGGISFSTNVGVVAPGTGVPTGTITLAINGHPSASTPLLNGTAQIFIARRGLLNRSVVINYSGDANVNAGRSTPFVLTATILNGNTAHPARGKGRA